jgi:hypothetical protein
VVRPLDSLVLGEHGERQRGQGHLDDRKPGREGGPRVRLPGLRQDLQAQEQPEEPPEVGVRQGAPVPVSLLLLSGQAEDARRPAHRARAQGQDQDRAQVEGLAIATRMMASAKIFGHDDDDDNHDNHDNNNDDDDDDDYDDDDAFPFDYSMLIFLFLFFFFFFFFFFFLNIIFHLERCCA